MPDAASGKAALGLDTAELAQFEKAFVAFADGIGLRGAEIHAGLMKGKTIGETLGVTPERLEAIYALASRHLGAGHHEKARRLFGALALFAPESHAYWFGLALAERSAGRTDRAEAILKTVERLKPEWAPLHFQRLEIAIERGDRPAARRAFREFRATSSEDVTDYMRLRVQRIAPALEGGSSDHRDV
jgi:tetratricopeptide (TPR) repeat protein